MWPLVTDLKSRLCLVPRGVSYSSIAVDDLQDGSKDLKQTGLEHTLDKELEWFIYTTSDEFI